MDVIRKRYQTRKRKKLFKSFIIVVWVLLMGSPSLKAQQYYTLYWMQGIPQSMQSNPALQPNVNFYLGFPAASSVYAGAFHTGFALQDLIKRNEMTETFYINEQSMLAALKDRNFLTAEYSHEWLTFGFRSGKNYYSLNVSDHLSGRFAYPKDLMYLLLEGNYHFVQEDRPANFGGLAMDMLHYRELGLSFSRHWSDNLSAGIRAKFLQGQANISFNDSKLDITTQPSFFELLLESDLGFNTNLPFAVAPLDSLGSSEFIDFNNDEEILSYLTNPLDQGFAVDLGVVYKPFDRFTIAASARDLGFINWKSNPENFRLSGEFEFEGLELNDFFEEGSEFEGESFTDSIVDLFSREETANEYTLMLPTKLFASVAFDLTDMHKLALLGGGQFYSGAFYPSFTASYNFQPINHFGTALSYSVVNGNFNNVGFGAHLDLAFLQLYLVFDNFFGATRPHTLQTFTVHFGVNIVAGHKKTEKDPVEPSFRW
ncbi:MAG: DUF5723 family protein [Bacteroidales bacterium]